MKTRIKEMRKALKLTQEEMSKRLDVSKSSVMNWEYGMNQPAPLMIEKMCRVFHISRTWLQTGEGPMSTAPESADEMIDEKLANGSEFARALLRVIGRMPDEELLIVERMFEDLQSELKKSQGDR